MCTILGQNIGVIRPSCPTTRKVSGGKWRVGTISNPWRGAKQTGRKTHKLTEEEKRRIASEMGFAFTGNV